MSDNANAVATSASSTNANTANVSNSSESSVENVSQQSQQTQQSQSTDVNQNLNQADVNHDVNSFSDLYSDNQQEDAENNETQQEKDPADLIPDTYEITTSTGEQLDGEDLDKLNQVCKKAGITQKQAQMLFSAYENDVSNFNQQLQSSYNQQLQSWRDAVMNDRELGQENFEKTKANIKNVIGRFGSSQLSDFLNKSGLGYNPDFVRFVNKVGSLISNDNNFIGGNTNSQVSEADRQKEMLMKLYNNTKEMRF